MPSLRDANSGLNGAFGKTLESPQTYRPCMCIPAGPLDDLPPLVRVRRANLRTVVSTIEQDFRKLADTLQRTIDAADSEDEELLIRLFRTRSVAERGVRLSRLLARLTRTKQA
jgi:hypothetical protein